MESNLYINLPLAAFGLLALFAGSGPWFRRRSIVHPKRRRTYWMRTCAFLIGLVFVIYASIDMGLEQWDKRRKLELEEFLRSEEDGSIGPMWPFVAGTLAPDFRLPTLKDGSLVSLKEFQGSRPVLLVLSSFT